MTDNHAERNISLDTRDDLMRLLITELEALHDQAVIAGATPEQIRTELQRRTNLLRSMTTDSQ
jgi:hypothetical protein